MFSTTRKFLTEDTCVLDRVFEKLLLRPRLALQGF